MTGPRAALHICATELRAEWRNRQVITTMLLLTGLSVVTFGFAGKANSTHLAAPALWVSLVLAAAAGIAQTIARYETSSVTTALRLGGAPRWAVFSGRLVAFSGLLSLTALVAWLLTAGLFGAPTQHLGTLAGLLALGTLGVATLGITIASTLAGAPGPSRLVPLLLLPLSLPVVLLAASATWHLGSPETLRSLLLLGLLDVALLALGVGINSRG